LSGNFTINCIIKIPILIFYPGESGVGKSALINHLLNQLGKEGGTSYKQGTVLGSVLNFTDKNQTLLSNISSLTKLGQEEEGR
jgi:predicted GTPase